MSKSHSSQTFNTLNTNVCIIQIPPEVRNIQSKYGWNTDLIQQAISERKSNQVLFCKASGTVSVLDCL